MSELRLMERIALAGQPQPTSRDRAGLRIASIQEHLQRLLNTRLGSVPSAPDYGMPDFTALAYTEGDEGTRRLMDQVLQMIKRYEPRLLNPALLLSAPDPQSQVLHFVLEGETQIRGMRVQVQLKTQYRSSGRVVLSTY